MSKEYLARSKNGKEVYWDPINSHGATHIGKKPDLKNLVEKVIGEYDVQGKNFMIEYDVGTKIGETDLVETGLKDEIIFAKRKNRDKFTRFVKNRQAIATSLVTIILHSRPDGTYWLFSAWIGPFVPPFPGGRRKHPDSLEFWSKHALVWGNQEIQPGTETTKQLHGLRIAKMIILDLRLCW